MFGNNDSSECDALLKASQSAEKEIAHARAAQQRAESKFMEVCFELNAERAKVVALKGGSHPGLVQAKAAGNRAAAQLQHMEAQLRRRQARLESLERMVEEIRREKELFRESL